LRAGIAADGITRMGDDAAHAYDLLADHAPARSICCLLAGAARHLSGDRGTARAYLEEGARRGAVAAPNIQGLCLAQLALLAIEGDDWASAEALATHARAQVERFGLSDYPTSALVFAVSAATRARNGRVDGAKIDAGRASDLMAKLANFASWYEVETRVALVWAALRLSDVAPARKLIEEAERLLSRMPDAIVPREWLDELWIRVDAAMVDRVVAQQSLTTAELRVLQFLPTHLSFPEVAEQLNVSANTIKTHARAVYRKLDARSRAQAVAHARDVGLIEQGQSPALSIVPA
jgi:LuxR family maltose regulon positive regulatory protein